MFQKRKNIWRKWISVLRPNKEEGRDLGSTTSYRDVQTNSTDVYEEILYTCVISFNPTTLQLTPVNKCPILRLSGESINKLVTLQLQAERKVQTGEKLQKKNKNKKKTTLLFLGS